MKDKRVILRKEITTPMKDRRTLIVKVTAALLLLTAGGSSAYADQRSLADARQIARGLLGNPVVAEAPALAPAARSLSADNTAASATGSTASDSANTTGSTTAAGTDLVPYYIFSDSQGDGFAVVSGTDRMRPVIGYSPSGTYSAESMPENFRHWLENIGQAAAYLESHPEVTLATAAADATVTPIAPLLGDIAWGQGSPFNRLCPSVGDTRCVTGCVATALAQCLYFYRYPTRGTGSKTYEGGTYAPSVTLDFSQQTYDYSLMFDQYDPNTDYSPAQLNEVAKLSYQAGVAVSMQYGKDASSSALSFIHTAVKRHFGYDGLVQALCRSQYTYDEWQTILRNELANSRPVIYGGNDDTMGGHCFILDGIDASGLYHANWGWYGTYDGYYDIAVLNPMTFKFCDDQMALVQLAPAGSLTGGRYYTPVNSNGTTACTISQPSVKLGDNVLVNVNDIFHFMDEPFVGYFGLAFVRDGKTKAVAMYNDTLSVPNGYYTSWTLPVKVPRSLESGSYEVYLMTKEYEGTNKDSIGFVRSNANQPACWQCSVSHSVAYFTLPSSDLTLTASDWNFGTDTLRTGSEQTITCRITNGNDATCCGRYVLALSAGDTCWAQSDIVTIPALSSATVTFGVTFSEAGQRTMDLYFWPSDFSSSEMTAVGGSLPTVTVVGDQTLSSNLVLTAKPALNADAAYGDSLFVGSAASFDVALSNKSGRYNGQLQVQFFKTATSTAPVATMTVNAALPAGAAGTYTLSGTLVKANDTFRPAASGTICYARVYYRQGSDYVLMGTASGVDNLTTVRIYAGSPGGTGLEKIAADTDSASVTVYDLMGRPCNPSGQLRPGIYIVNGKKKVIR